MAATPNLPKAPASSSRDRAAPLVSIVIDNFNYGRFVGEAIDSALAQTYPHCEVIIVDDGSTDDSAAVIRGYGARIQALFQANAGQGAAYNRGFEASRGDIVIFLDADDVLEPHAVARLVPAFGPRTTKVHFYMDVVDEEGNRTGRRMPNFPFIAGDVLPCMQVYGYYPSTPGSGNAYRRSFLEKIMPVDPVVWPMGSDAVMHVLARVYGEVGAVHEPLGRYRVHAQNDTFSGYDLKKLRRDLLKDLRREAILHDHARRQGLSLPPERTLNIPEHCKRRLISLKLDPVGHPIAGDSVLRLVARGILAAFRFPHNSLKKAIVSSMLFPAIALAPAPVLERRLPTLLFAHRRSRLVRAFVR